MLHGIILKPDGTATVKGFRSLYACIQADIFEEKLTSKFLYEANCSRRVAWYEIVGCYYYVDFLVARRRYHSWSRVADSTDSRVGRASQIP